MGRDGPKIGLHIWIFFVITVTAGAGCLGVLLLQNYSRLTDAWYFPYSVVVLSALTAGVAAFLFIWYQREIRKRLSRRSGELQAIVDSLPDACFVLDREGNYCRVMTRRKELLVAPAEELLASGVEEQLPPEPAEKCMTAIEQVLDTGEIKKVEYSLSVPAGERHFSVRISPLTAERVVFVARDITDLKEREKELKAINQQLKATEQELRAEIEERKQVEEDLRLTKFCLDNASVGVLRVTPGGQIEYANDRMCELLNYSQEELRGKRVADIDPNYPREKREKRWKQVKGDSIDYIETQNQTKGGEKIPVQVISRYLQYGDNEYEFAFVRDISERREKERRIRGFKTAFDTAMEGIGIVVEAEAGELVTEYANDALARLHGYEAGGITGEPIHSFHPEVEYEKLEKSVEKVAEEGSWSGEIRRQRQDGSTFPSLTSVTFFESEPGEKKYVVICRDITEQKEKEKELKDLNQQLEAQNQQLASTEQELRAEIEERKAIEEDLRLTKFCLDNASVGVLRVTPGGAIEYVNDWACEMFNYSREELTSKGVVDIEVGHSEELRSERWQRIKENKIDRIETRVETKNGDEFSVQVISRYLEYEGQEYEFAFAQDISERKARERKIKRQNERLENVIKGTEAGTWEWNVQTGEATINDRSAEILGYTLEEFSPVTIDTWRELTHPEDLERAEAKLEKHFQGEVERYGVELRMKHKEDHWVWVSARGKVVSWSDEGEPLRMFGTYVDISNRKRREQRVREFKTAFDTARSGLAIAVEEPGKGPVIEYANEAGNRMHGYEHGELIGKSIKAVHPDSEHEKIENSYELLEEEGSWSGEIYHQRKDGSTFPTISSATLFKTESGEKKYVAICRDITDQKEQEKQLQDLNQQLEAQNQRLKATENKLRESEEKFRTIFEDSPLGIELFDESGNLIEANQASLEIFGNPDLESLKGFNFLEDPHLPERVRQKLQAGETVGYETEIDFEKIEKLGLYETSRSGQIHIDARVVYLGSEETDIGPCYLSQIQEVTERKEKERELRENREFLQQVLETSPVGIVVFDSGGEILRANDRALEIFGLSREEIIGRSYDADAWGTVEQTGEPLFAASSLFSRVLTDREAVFDVDQGVRLPDGQNIWITLNLAPVFGDDGEINQVVGAFEDVTRRREMEAEIREALEAKEVMLQEIHHRVKNNLQVICSLLDMRAQTAIQEVEKPLIETRNRVNSMALIHDRIYQSETPSAVNIKNYLEELIAGLRATYDRGQQEIEVRLEVDETVRLELGRAVSCALILNELLANAFEHAFDREDEAKNIVRVSFQPDGSDFDYRLRISDNGQGLPADYEIGGIGEQDSLGLGLVKSLVEKQLDGQLEVSSPPGEGTEFVAEF